MAHTPGPWETDAADHDEPYQDIVIRAGRRRVAKVWQDDAPVRDYNAEQWANARLIAASPDLLAVAQRLAARGWFIPTPCADEATSKDMADMLTAIAKATGGEA